MRVIQSKRKIQIPNDVNVTVKCRVVRVKGPRGILVRDFSHVPINLQILLKGIKKFVTAEVCFGQRTSVATIRTVTTHIQNMVSGVTKGYRYKMRMIYSHFPISVGIEDKGKRVEIRNFLGEKIVRHVKMTGDVVVQKSVDGVKDEIVLTGNSVEQVAQCAANIQQICRARNKDIRKFLDGVYVSERGFAVLD
jgi:large subunit ribosomal protein L9e